MKIIFRNKEERITQTTKRFMQIMLKFIVFQINISEIWLLSKNKIIKRRKPEKYIK